MSLERHDYSQGECNNEANTKYIKAYMGWITPRVKGRVLDLGAGLGYPTLLYAEKPDVSRIVATDKYFDDEKTSQHAKIKWVRMRTEHFIQKRHDPFDTITCTEHIEHLEQPTQMAVLNFAQSHLTKGGHFLGSMPDCEKSGNPYHLKEYTHQQWENLLRQHFKCVEVQVLIPGLLYVWDAACPL